MSNLAVLAYDDGATATQVRARAWLRSAGCCPPS